MGKSMKIRSQITMLFSAFLLISSLGLQPARAQSDSPSSANRAKPFTYEFSYKVKWGHLDEFLNLYKKNHLPILRKQKERGEILSLSATSPINHANEDSRWDIRMTVVYRDAVVAHEDPSELPWVKALYPDQVTFKREEQRRFELLLEHTDVPISIDDLSTW